MPPTPPSRFHPGVPLSLFHLPFFLFLLSSGADALSETYRLPPLLKPLSYHLHLNFSARDSRHGGLLLLSFRVRRSAQSLTLHAHRLSFPGGASLNCSRSGPFTLQPPKLNAQHQTAVFEGMSMVAAETCQLQLPYQWRLARKGNVGPFFESQDTFLLITKFQPNFARMLFPCLDEPAYKAKFWVNVYLSPWDARRLLVRSNMPRKGPPRLRADWERLHYAFEPSPLMSPYLLALSVLNASVPRVSTPPSPLPSVEAIGHASAAALLDTAKLVQDATRLLNRRLRLHNPLPKITYAKVRKYPSGTKPLQLRWDDIWLNEGFTNYVNCLLMDDLRRNGWKKIWSSAQCFGRWRSYAIREAMRTDLSLVDDRNYPVFQAHPYAVGPTLLRMLESLLGREYWAEFLRRYVGEYAYGAVSSGDLVAMLASELGPKDPRVESWKTPGPVPVDAFLRSWLLQPHMPNVTVTYHAALATFTLRQSCSLSSCQLRWYIPVRNYSPRYRRLSPWYWLTPTETEIRVRSEESDLVWNPGDETFLNLHYARFPF